MRSDKSEIKKGTCPVCGIGCHVNVHIAGGKITRIEPDPESPVNRRLCERAVAAASCQAGPRSARAPQSCHLLFRGGLSVMAV